MKDNILTNVYGIGGQIQKFISLESKRITKKHKRSSTRREFTPSFLKDLQSMF